VILSTAPIVAIAMESGSPCTAFRSSLPLNRSIHSFTSVVKELNSYVSFYHQSPSLFGSNHGYGPCSRHALPPSSCTGGTSTGSKAGNRAIKFAHGAGLCNMPLFYAAEKQLFSKYGFSGTAALTPNARRCGGAAGHRPGGNGSNSLYQCDRRYTQGASFQVVAGSGVEGLILVAKPEI
jgi:hypothetical protein